MHEQAAMRNLVGRIVGLAEHEGATSVTQVDVRLGALSRFTPEHFREHYVDASRGTIAADAAVDAELADDPHDEHAADVVLLGVELEIPG
jgi:hydrogenase nickel incorporation protein HypA/HybF